VAESATNFPGQPLPLKVTYIDANDNYTVLNPTQYSVTYTTPQANQLWSVGGYITYPLSGAALAAGTSILIQRILPLDQDVSIRNQGNYYAQVTEQALDVLEMQIQQVATTAGNSIQIPAGDVGANVVLPPQDLRKGFLLGFDTIEGSVQLYPNSSGGTGGAGITSLTQSTGITLTPNPITSSGSVAITPTAVTAGSYTNANVTFNAEGQATSASNGSINEGFNNYIIAPTFQNIPNPPSASLTQVFAAGTVMFNNVVQAVPSYTLTMPTNSITRIWWTGTAFQVDTVASNNYVNLPRYYNYLPLWECQSNGTTINSINQMGNDFETLVIPNDYANVMAQVPELYGISVASAPTAWTSGGTATYRTIYVNSLGYLYQCFVPGTFGASQPTGTNYSGGILNPITNGQVTLYYYGQFNFVGNFRYGINNQIENYFTNIGVGTMSNLVDANGVQFSTYAKAYWINQFKNLILNRVNSGTYQFGMKCIAGGYIWLNTTFGTAGSGGTAASSSPFSGSYTPNVSTVTDGTITWLCIYQSYASQNAFWMDTNTDPTMLTYTFPDSHDSYASTLFAGLAAYIKQTNDWQWLLGNSVQPSGSAAYKTYLSLLQTIFDLNLLPLSNNLTLTFQSNIDPQNGASFTTQFQEDNAESYSGLIAAQYIFTLLGDGTRGGPSGQAAANAALVNSGLYLLANLTYNVMTEFYGDNPATWPITNPNLPFYPYYQMQYFPELHQIPSIDDDLKQQFRDFVLSKWSSFYGDKSKDTTPVMYIAFIAAKYWQDIPKATALINIAERYYIHNEGMNIDDFGYYVQTKSLLVNNSTISNISGVKVTFEDAGGNLYTTNQSRIISTSGAATISMFYGDGTLNCSLGGAAVVDLPIRSTLPDRYPVKIKDIAGNFNTYNVTVTPDGGSIDGSGTITLSTNYGVAKYVYDQTENKWYTD